MFISRISGSHETYHVILRFGLVDRIILYHQIDEAPLWFQTIPSTIVKTVGRTMDQQLLWNAKCWSYCSLSRTVIGTLLLCKPSNLGLVLCLPQAKKSSSKSKKANGAKDFRNKGPLRYCLRLTRALSYRRVWANPQAVAYETFRLSRAQMYRASIMKKVIPWDGKMSLQLPVTN